MAEALEDRQGRHHVPARDAVADIAVELARCHVHQRDRRGAAGAEVEPHRTDDMADRGEALLHRSRRVQADADQRPRRVERLGEGQGDAVERRRLAGAAAEELAADRRVDHAEAWMPALEQADRDRPLIVAAHEIGGAIDRVDDPEPPAAAVLATAFLAEDTVLREELAQFGGDEAFDGLVGLGDEVEMPFHRHRQARHPREMVERDRAGLAGERFDGILGGGGGQAHAIRSGRSGCGWRHRRDRRSDG